MKRDPRAENAAARVVQLPTGAARDRAKRRIVVTPEQVLQEDRRPWRQTTLNQAMLPFLVVSAIIVAVGVTLLLLGLAWAL